MSGSTAEALREALRAITDPASGRDIVTAGLVEGIELHGGLVQVSLLATRELAAALEPVRRAAEALLARQPGITNAAVVLTAHKNSAPRKDPAPQPSAREAAGAPTMLAEVRNIIAVASGKGGVGKSTVAVNLAVALARQGLDVGLLDADIHGPSLPRMLGLAGRPAVRGEQLLPVAAWGLKAMSIGLLVDEDTAMIWRGPMVMGALQQLLGQVAWGALDVLVVDFPPGTGDVQLTMAQRVAMSGAVIVSTPQDVALADARRGLRMFEQVRVPVLGLIENMSFFCCPNCGHQSDIFGHGGAEAEAARLGVDFLGAVPLLLDIRESGDAGAPVVATAPDSPAGAAFAAIAQRVWQKLQTSGPRGAGPRIRID